MRKQTSDLGPRTTDLHPKLKAGSFNSSARGLKSNVEVLALLRRSRYS
jgi:hypothetical protein